MRAILSISSLVAIMGLLEPCAAQTLTSTLTPAQIVDKASPAVAMVLATQSAGETNAVAGAAIVVYADGDLLLPYHLIRNAYAVQVRFKSGEVFDRVKLLGYDERRDIAAVRISASGLPVLPLAAASEINPGDPVVSIFHPVGQLWSTSVGVITAFRLADEIPGAGTGFRVFQFTAPASPGLSSGVLVDSKGRALGLITGSLDGGQSLNVAVPIENVLGLADTPPVKSFASGSQLLPPHPGASPAPVQPNLLPPTPAAPSEAVQPAPLPAPKPHEEPAASKDREYLLRHFSTMYIDARDAKFFGADRLKADLATNKDFAALHVSVVDDPKTADTILIVGYSAVWDFPFELKHQASSIMLVAGKGVGPLSGILGARDVASELIKALKPYRTPNGE
ncbi:MAG: S1C family serine protease [Terracidiphilus sp.]